MANVTIELETGLKVGGEAQTLAEIRPSTVADYLDATEAAERLVQTPEGEYRLVANPELVGVHLLRMQIVRIGDHDGPLTLGEIRRFSMDDMELLSTAAGALEAAKMGEGQPGAEAGKQKRQSKT